MTKKITQACSPEKNKDFFRGIKFLVLNYYREYFTRRLAHILFALLLVTYIGMTPALGIAKQDDYCIISPDNASEVDKFAVKELNVFLSQVLGKKISVYVVKGANTTEASRIFVGSDDAVKNILGEKYVTNLADQEHVVQALGNDIFLYGAGVNGNLYAVYEFLENHIGICWYNARGGIEIPKLQKLKVDASRERVGFDFPVRAATITPEDYYNRPTGQLFLLRNRQNLLLAKLLEDNGINGVNDVELLIPRNKLGVHSLFSYLPPHEKHKSGQNAPFKWIKNKNYFITNPEYFSLAKSGKRVDDGQLCFSNPELRKTLTTNIVDTIKLNNNEGVLQLDSNDFKDKFCYCPGCLALEQKYNSIGGPYFDYLVELGMLLEKDYPKTKVRAMLYRKEQSEKPPSNIVFPGNIIGIFAPIEDDFSQSFAHSNNQQTYKNLEKWCELLKNVWVWYYPNPYKPLPVQLPIGNINRLITDIKMIKQVGAQGIYFEHDAISSYNAFSELQTYLILKLSQDIKQDSNKLIKKFMLLQYGQAASLMGKYLNELEETTKLNNKFLTWNPSPSLFIYLNSDNLQRWNIYFDEMEKLVSDDSERLMNVRRVRVNLDYAMINNYKKIKKDSPDFSLSVQDLLNRARENFIAGMENNFPKKFTFYRDRLLSRFDKEIELPFLVASAKTSQYPAFFNKYKEDDLGQAIGKSYSRPSVEDETAAFGLAGDILTDELPYSMGFYDDIAKTRGVSRKIDISEIEPDRYKFYRLGIAELSPDCRIWTSKSWYLDARIGHLYEAGSRNVTEIFVSLKFEGPAYGGQGKVNRVLCDRVVIVRLSSPDKSALKPVELPAELTDIDKNNMIELEPVTYQQSNIPDMTSAYGSCAVLNDCKELPFKYGIYDSSTKKYLLRGEITKDSIEYGKYKFYKLGKAKLNPNTRLFLGKMWFLGVDFKTLTSVQSEQNYEVYISLKFSGVAYGGTDADEPNQVMADRVVFGEIAVGCDKTLNEKTEQEVRMK